MGRKAFMTPDCCSVSGSGQRLSGGMAAVNPHRKRNPVIRMTGAAEDIRDLVDRARKLGVRADKLKQRKEDRLLKCWECFGTGIGA